MTQKRAKILCVDDQPSGLEGRKMLFEELGYDVLVAESGATALQLFSSQQVDLVLLDYHMPEMNGDVVAERMKAAQPDIPVVMLSGDEDLPDRILQLADALVSKSELPAHLIEVVEHVLEVNLLFTPLSELNKGGGQQRVA